MVVYYKGNEMWGFPQPLSHEDLILFQTTTIEGGTLLGPANITQPPNWYGLEQDFWQNINTFSYILNSPTQALLFQVVDNGKKRESTEQALLVVLGALGIAFTNEQKADLNQLLANNAFTISLV